MPLNFLTFRTSSTVQPAPNESPAAQTPELPLVVGLDIGTTKICAVVARRNENGKVDILGMGKAVSHGVNRGTVANIESTVKSITEAVTEAAASSAVDIGTVNVGIAGQHIRSHQQRNMLTRHDNQTEISLEDVDRLRNEIFRVPQQAGYEIINVLAQDYIVDGEKDITNPVGMSGITLEGMFHVITGSVGAIMNIKRCVEKADLEIEGLTLEPLASAQAVLGEDEKEAGVVLVDIGGGTTDIAIFHQNIIRHTAVIPLGGNVITHDIQEGCSVLFDQAEALKTRFGSAVVHSNMANEVVSIPGLRGREPREVSVHTLASIISARVKEIIQHVQFEIRNSGYEKRLSAGIVLTGGGAQLSNIKLLFSVLTGLEARIGDSREHLCNASEELKSPIYATVAGLVLTSLADLDYREKTRVQADEDTEATMTKQPSPPPRQEDPKGLLNRLLKGLGGILSDPDLNQNYRR